MFNPRIKFEMSTITCNEEMKGNAKCKKILVLSHPLGDLGVGLTHRVHLWLERKRVVKFLLAIIAILASSRGCRNRRLLTGVCQFERKF